LLYRGCLFPCFLIVGSGKIHLLKASPVDKAMPSNSPAQLYVRHNRPTRASVEEPLLSPASIMSVDAEDAKYGTHFVSSERSAGSPIDEDERPDSDVQAGVQNIEATTLAWTKSALIIAYIMIWFIYFVDNTSPARNPQ
jgi:hypothetical protein